MVAMKIRIYPPIIAGIYLLLALGLDYFFPSVKMVQPPFNFLGIVIIVGGVVLIVWASRLFRKKGTTHHPYDEPTVLVTTGSFRFSRNPMYLGMSFVLLGIAIFIATIPLFLAPLAFFLTINTAVIPREERKLMKIFDQKYSDYKNHVRRWF